MKFMDRVQPRDVIALVVLIAIFTLLVLGFDGWLQGIGAVIIGYYFSKRVYEEKNPNGDLSEKVQKLEIQINEPKVKMVKFANIVKPVPEIKEPLATGDFHPVIKKEIIS